MCGETYSSGYAALGVEQLKHYMENNRSHLGYLIVFDCRRRDFGTGIEKETKSGPDTIAVEFVDIRPDVISKSASSSSLVAYWR